MSAKRPRCWGSTAPRCTRAWSRCKSSNRLRPHENDEWQRATRKMYLDHFGLNEPPFRITPHTDFFFAGANRGATLEALLYAITHDEGIVKVTGEVGSGKTIDRKST